MYRLTKESEEEEGEPDGNLCALGLLGSTASSAAAQGEGGGGGGERVEEEDNKEEEEWGPWSQKPPSGTDPRLYKS